MIEFDENTLKLIAIGFTKIGSWGLIDECPQIEYLNDSESVAIQNSKPALYAFVVNGELKYLGKTSKSLRNQPRKTGRLYGYIKPGKNTATNQKCHNKIKELLNEKKEVIVLGFSPDTLLCYGEFQISLPAGLEDILIKKMNPEWNGRQPGTNIAESESATYEREENPELNIPPEDAPTPPIGAPTFNIKLRKAYYNQGYMNPGVKVDRYIGKHGEPILIYLGGVNQDSVRSIITRTANDKGTARIKGRADVRDWFQKHFKYDDVVKATIVDPTRIVLSLN